jgi:hypothetical protein
LTSPLVIPAFFSAMLVISRTAADTVILL